MEVTGLARYVIKYHNFVSTEKFGSWTQRPNNDNLIQIIVDFFVSRLLKKYGYKEFFRTCYRTKMSLIKTGAFSKWVLDWNQNKVKKHKYFLSKRYGISIKKGLLRRCNGTVSFLSSRVPYLSFYGFSINL